MTAVCTACGESRECEFKGYDPVTGVAVFLCAEHNITQEDA